MFSYKTSEKGFTLVELVVVIAILALILAATIAILDPIKQIDKAMTSQKESDLEQIRTALDLYYSDNSCYPASGAIPFGSTWNGNNTVYMQKVPQSPDSSQYIYETYGNCPQWYVLYAKVTVLNSGTSVVCPLNCHPPDDSNNHICVYGGIVDCSYITSFPLNDSGQ